MHWLALLRMDPWGLQGRCAERLYLDPSRSRRHDSPLDSCLLCRRTTLTPNMQARFENGLAGPNPFQTKCHKEQRHGSSEINPVCNRQSGGYRSA